MDVPKTSWLWSAVFKTGLVGSLATRIVSIDELERYEFLFVQADGVEAREAVHSHRCEINLRVAHGVHIDITALSFVLRIGIAC